MANDRNAVKYTRTNQHMIEKLGYSVALREQAFKGRFTESSVDRILLAAKALQGVKITNKDFSKVLNPSGKNVFVFLDPPYYSNSESKLYGKHGQLHTKFNHEVFFKELVACRHNWLVTYDNCSKIQTLFEKNRSENWLKIAWRLRYGANNSSKKIAKIGNELFMLNYRMKDYLQ